MDVPVELEERALTQETTAVVEKAKNFTVATNEDFQAAGEFLRTIKDGMKKVENFFAESKQKSFEAWRAVCLSEKKLLDPLANAEKVMKDKMGAYVQKVQKEREQAEIEARKRQEEEANRLLAQAVESESQGDVFGAQMAMAAAAMVEDMAPAVRVEQPKAEGISTRYKWVAEVVDESAVPISVNGIVIRPVDEKKLAELAKVTNGTAQVPGVRFKKEPIIVSRR